MEAEAEMPRKVAGATELQRVKPPETRKSYEGEATQESDSIPEINDELYCVLNTNVVGTQYYNGLVHITACTVTYAHVSPRLGRPWGRSRPCPGAHQPI